MTAHDRARDFRPDNGRDNWTPRVPTEWKYITRESGRDLDSLAMLEDWRDGGMRIVVEIIRRAGEDEDYSRCELTPAQYDNLPGYLDVTILALAIPTHEEADPGPNWRRAKRLAQIATAIIDRAGHVPAGSRCEHPTCRALLQLDYPTGRWLCPVCDGEAHDDRPSTARLRALEAPAPVRRTSRARQLIAADPRLDPWA